MADAPFLPGRGRKSFGDAPGGGNYGEKWHQRLDYLEFPKGPKPKEIRIVGGVFTVNQHYVQFKKKDGGRTGYYEVCPDFDWNTGQFRQGVDSVCPICKDFSDSDLPDELRMYGSFRYFFDAYDVSRIRSGSNDGAFGVVYTNKYGKNDIAKISDTLEAYVDDLKRGCSIFWYFNPKSKDPKDRVSFTRGDTLAIKYNKKKDLYLLELDGTRAIGSPTNFDEIVDVKDPVAIRADLQRLGLYDQLDEYLSATKGKSRRAAPDKAPDFGDDEDISSWEDDEAEEEEPKKKPTKKKPAKKKTAKKKTKPEPEPEPEDDDWADDDDDDVETPPEDRDFDGDDSDENDADDWADDDDDDAGEEAPVAEDAEDAEDDDWADDDDSAAADSNDDDDDDDAGWEDDEDEEPEPKPKPKKKPAKKKPTKKKTAKKKTAKKKTKPEPEDDEEDDDFGDDW